MVRVQGLGFRLSGRLYGAVFRNPRALNVIPKFKDLEAKMPGLLGWPAGFAVRWPRV